jgi:hypothetical protein
LRKLTYLQIYGLLLPNEEVVIKKHSIYLNKIVIQEISQPGLALPRFLSCIKTTGVELKSRGCHAIAPALLEELLLFG